MKKKQKILIGAVMAVIAACILLHPWYVRYMENDHRETCIKARFVIVDRYDHACEKLAADGAKETDVDFMKILLDTVRKNFPDAQITRTEDPDVILVSNLCRSGGTYTITMVGPYHRINLECDYRDHGEFNWGFDKGFWPGED